MSTHRVTRALFYDFVTIGRHAFKKKTKKQRLRVGKIFRCTNCDLHSEDYVNISRREGSWIFMCIVIVCSRRSQWKGNTVWFSYLMLIGVGGVCVCVGVGGCFLSADVGSEVVFCHVCVMQCTPLKNVCSQEKKKRKLEWIVIYFIQFAVYVGVGVLSFYFYFFTDFSWFFFPTTFSCVSVNLSVTMVHSILKLVPLLSRSFILLYALTP